MEEFEYTEKMMGTRLSLSVVTGHAGLATMIAKDTIERLKTYELQFSRFLSESELSRLNYERSLVVSIYFLTVFDVAHELYRKTNGYFNPLLQASRLGYNETFDTLRGARMLDNDPYNINMDDVSIDRDERRITLVGDQQLDFSGILKGFIAENEARRIMSENPAVHGVIVNLGGDLFTKGCDVHGKPFIFEIENPITGVLITVPLENKALATSGTYKRKWETSRGTIHHIVGRGGTTNPEATVIAASVVHDHGADAEAYAKTLISLSPDELERMTGEYIRCVRVHKDGVTENTL